MTTATERDYYRTVIETARITGWRIAHFRPALNRRGYWSTPVQGDGAGFPDFVLVHAKAGRVWFRELKTDGAHETETQHAWGTDLLRAGGNYELIHVPSDAHRFLQDLADANRWRER